MIHPLCPSCAHCQSTEFDDHNGQAAIVHQCNLDESAEPLPSGHYCAKHTVLIPIVREKMGPWHTVLAHGVRYVTYHEATKMAGELCDIIEEANLYLGDYLLMATATGLPATTVRHVRELIKLGAEACGNEYDDDNE